MILSKVLYEDLEWGEGGLGVLKSLSFKIFAPKAPVTHSRFSPL